MSYATIDQLSETYGWQELAELLCDERDFVEKDLLIDIHQNNPLDDWSEDQQQAGVAALTRAQEALKTQTNFINSKVGVRFILPLPVEAVEQSSLKEACLALTRAFLADDGDNLAKSVKDERDYWRTWLSDLVSGKSHINGAVVKGNEAKSSDAIKRGKIKSQINWECY